MIKIEIMNNLLDKTSLCHLELTVKCCAYVNTKKIFDVSFVLKQIRFFLHFLDEVCNDTVVVCVGDIASTYRHIMASLWSHRHGSDNDG